MGKYTLFIVSNSHYRHILIWKRPVLGASGVGVGWMCGVGLHVHAAVDLDDLAGDVG